jgi:hypothetical protein
VYSFFGIGFDGGMFPVYKIDLLEPQHYVQDRVNGCQCNSRSWWQRCYYFAIGGGQYFSERRAFKSCGLRALQAGSVKLSPREDDLSAAYSSAVPDPLRGRGKYLGSIRNSCSSAAERVGPPTIDDRSQLQFMAPSHDASIMASTALKVRIRVNTLRSA